MRLRFLWVLIIAALSQSGNVLVAAWVADPNNLCTSTTTPTVNTFTCKFADFQNGITFSLDEPQEGTAEPDLDLIISNTTWATPGDFQFFTGTVTNCQGNPGCSDIVRFVNVANAANIFFRSDGAQITTAGLPALPAGSTVSTVLETDARGGRLDIAEATPDIVLGITAFSDGDPSSGMSDQLKVFFPMPEPTTLLSSITGIAMLASLLIVRRRCR